MAVVAQILEDEGGYSMEYEGGYSMEYEGGRVMIFGWWIQHLASRRLYHHLRKCRTFSADVFSICYIQQLERIFDDELY